MSLCMEGEALFAAFECLVNRINIPPDRAGFAVAHRAAIQSDHRCNAQG